MLRWHTPCLLWPRLKCIFFMSVIGCPGTPQRPAPTPPLYPRAAVRSTAPDLQELGDKTIVLGVIDCGTEEIETVETVADRIRAALQHLPSERLVLAPDCGMKYLSRAAAFGKLKAMADAARIVRGELRAIDSRRMTDRK